MDTDARISLVGEYARRLHATVGDRHHVASPLGAWLLVALCAPLVEEERPGVLAEVAGADPLAAARFAAELLRDPHPLVASAVATWTAHGAATPRLRTWLAALPAVVETGELPNQEQANAWARAHSLGLIESFPLEPGRDLVVLLASAVATKVSWEVPFEVVGAEQLGPSPWARQVATVLRSPADPRHRQFLAQSGRAGLVAVHLARARDGLLVGSVIAVDPGVAPGEVLAAAGAIVSREARFPHSSPVTSLFDCPLADGPVLSLVEAPVSTAWPDAREERFVSVLPAWRARSDLDLYENRLGFPEVGEALAAALGREQLLAGARQAAMARYTAVGFEAAAVTGLAMAVSRPHKVEGLRRTATLRFNRPYAVVAACEGPRRSAVSGDHWTGLPVFSAWVKVPSDA